MNQEAFWHSSPWSSFWPHVSVHLLSGVTCWNTSLHPHCLWFQHYVNGTAVSLTPLFISTLFGFAVFILPPSTCVLLVKLFCFWDVIQREVLVRISFSSTNFFDKVAWPMVLRRRRTRGGGGRRRGGREGGGGGKKEKGRRQRKRKSHSINYLSFINSVLKATSWCSTIEGEILIKLLI